MGEDQRRRAKREQVSEDKEMLKAMRQKPGQPGRAGEARGEAAREPACDEASGPLFEHPRTGSTKSKVSPGGLLEAALTRGWGNPDSHDLKRSNRPVRTRMPGGVAGVQRGTAAPYADVPVSAACLCSPNVSATSPPSPQPSPACGSGS